MSVWSAIRRSPATLALLGGAGQFLGEMNKSREALETEKRQMRTRLGELTLRQMLEDQSKTTAEKRQQTSPLYQAQVGQAQAGQRAQELSGQRTQQDIDYVNSLAPEARQAWEAGKRTPEELQAEIESKQGYTEYLRGGGAGGAKNTLQLSKDEQQRQLEQTWWEQTTADRAVALSDPQRDYAVYNLGLEYRLDEKLSPRWRVWLTDYRRREAGRAAKAKAKASKPDLNSLLQGLGAGSQPAQTGAPGPVAAPGAPAGLGAPDSLSSGLGPAGPATAPLLGPGTQAVVTILMSQGMTREQAIQGLQARGKNLAE